QDSIGKSCVAEVLPGDVVKSLRTIRGSHPVDLHDDETNLRLGHHARVSEKRLRNERTLWSSINVFDHGILLRRIEVCRPNDHAPDICLPIAALRGKNFRRLPAGFCELTRIASLNG